MKADAPRLCLSGPWGSALPAMNGHYNLSTGRLHEKFLEILEVSSEAEDPSNKLLDVETQLRRLREIGFDDVDCHWKWLELAWLVGVKR